MGTVKVRTITLCRECNKAIGFVEAPGLDLVGWLHYSSHDGHRAMPKRSSITGSDCNYCDTLEWCCRPALETERT